MLLPLKQPGAGEPDSMPSGPATDDAAPNEAETTSTRQGGPVTASNGHSAAPASRWACSPRRSLASAARAFRAPSMKIRIRSSQQRAQAHPIITRAKNAYLRPSRLSLRLGGDISAQPVRVGCAPSCARLKYLGGRENFRYLRERQSDFEHIIWLDERIVVNAMVFCHEMLANSRSDSHAILHPTSRPRSSPPACSNTPEHE